MRRLIVANWALTGRNTRNAVRLFLGTGLLLFSGCRPEAAPAARGTSTAMTSGISRQSTHGGSTAAYAVRTQVGFRSRKNLDEHFSKHGREFRGLSKDQYLLAAQTLRDRPVGGDVEEIIRGDGTASRFDRVSGAFLAFNRDGTIRTFFKPNDGEQYFRRQAQRSH